MVYLPADEVQRPGWAGTHAFPAQIASDEIYFFRRIDKGVRVDGILRTGRDTQGMMLAQPGAKFQFDRFLLGFRVAAPQAAQRAALEENNRTDTGPIVDGVALNIKDQTFQKRISARWMMVSWTSLLSSTKTALYPPTRTMRSR